MNLMDLFIKVGVKDEASGSIKKISGAVGKGLATAAKVGIAALGAASAAVGALVTQSVKAYADYEQLVGGVETLFSNLEGTVSAAPQVLANAAKAYETAGLSANQYMETVTSFSAALVASLGNDYEEAARISDMAITDMADNANKMGTSMESIQAAYQGFAKQNYTMLDNLKLGYGGTKTEMERLLADAEKITGVKYDISNLADVYTAIHVIQGEIGITGTTAEEAASTISGSLGMLKASWANLLTGLADPAADINKQFRNVEQSAKTFLKNIKPVVARALKSMGSLVKDLAPEIAKELPGLVDDLLPDVLEAASGLVSGIAEALPEIVSTLAKEVPRVVETLVPSLLESAGKLVSALFDALPALLESAGSILDMLFESVASGDFETAVLNAVDGINQIINQIIDWLANPEKLTNLIESAVHIVVALAKGIIKFAVNLLEKLPELIQSLADWFTDSENLEMLKDSGVEIINALWEGMKSAWPAVLAWASGAAGGIAYNFGGTVAGGVGKGHAIGNDYVPYDNYPALLHRGEAVLTAREADAWRRGEGSGRQIVNNFTFNGVSQSDLDRIVAYVNREMVSG